MSTPSEKELNFEAKMEHGIQDIRELSKELKLEPHEVLALLTNALGALIAELGTPPNDQKNINVAIEALKLSIDNRRVGWPEAGRVCRSINQKVLPSRKRAGSSNPAV